MFVTVIALKYALSVSERSYGHFLKLTDSVLLNDAINLSHLTKRIMPCYTHKMAIVSWLYRLCDVTSLYAYRGILLRYVAQHWLSRNNMSRVWPIHLIRRRKEQASVAVSAALLIGGVLLVGLCQHDNLVLGYSSGTDVNSVHQLIAKSVTNS